MAITRFTRPKIIGSVAGLLVAATLWAQDDFEAFLQQDQAAQAEFARADSAAFAAFRQAEEKAFEAFKAEVEAQWGQYSGSTRTDWVEYGEGLDSRSRVDFEAGEAEVEVLVEADSPQEAQAQAQEKLQTAVESLVKDRGKSSDYSVDLPDGSTDKPKPLEKEPVLKGQVADAAGKTVTPANAADFAREAAAAPKVKTQAVQGKDGKKRYKATVRFPLVGDHVEKRARRYVPLVQKYAERYELDPALVFAVIHTESSFNPKARSGAPAYGLMQLVPTSGGRDAYRFVYKKDKVLPPSYFYEPDRNIELGCAYLHHLQQHVFKTKADDRKGLYCAVSAYNTGAGNVSRVFTGKRRISDALPLIKKYKADDLYAKLVKELPYEETRHYLRKVIGRIPLYTQGG